MAASVDIQGKAVRVWPSSQKIETFCTNPTMVVTDFDDIEQYHDRLIDNILQQAQEKTRYHLMTNGGGRVRDVHDWGIAEARLLDQRARMLFEKIVGQKPEVEASWATISGPYDTLSIHSHTDCMASVVYMLKPGDPPPPGRPLSGRLAFADPRIDACCPDQDDCVTREVHTDMKPGCMIMFPSQMMHHVHTYYGQAPRITIAWNMSC